MIKFFFEITDNNTILATYGGWTNEYTSDGDVDTSLEYTVGNEITQEEAEMILNEYGWVICEKCGNIFADGEDCDYCLGANMRNKFYNGKEITKENLLNMIGECIESNWKNSDLFNETEEALEKMYQGYEGVEEDISSILENLKNKNRFGWNFAEPNLQSLEIIISEGKWYFQEVL